MDLITVPDPVVRTAAAALAERARRGEGGTARGLTIATALSTGHVFPREVAELRAWHTAHPETVQGDRSTLLAGLYGGADARAWCKDRQAAAMNPAGEGVMISLPVPPDIAAQVARPDGEPADEMHITLFYFGKPADEPALDDRARDTLRGTLDTFAHGTESPVVHLTHVERFTADVDGMEPAVLVDDGPSVYALREALQVELAAAGPQYRNDHAFRVHMTIGYYETGDGPEQGPLPDVEGSDGGYQWRPESIELHWGGDVETFLFANPDDLDGPEPVTAAVAHPSAAKLARMSRVLNRTNTTLRTRLHAAAQVALEEALRQAGAKVIARAKGTRAKATTAAAVQAHGITEAVCAAVGVTEQELLDRRFDAFALAAAGWITAAELRKVRATATALGLDGDDLAERYGDEIDARAVAAAGFLVAGLEVIARASLAGGPEPAALGELSGPVPFTLVRDAWTIGATGATVPQVPERGVGPVGVGKLPRPEKGTTITEQLLADADMAVQVRSTWAVGAPDRPFEPHQALDGLSWVDTQPPELDWDPGEFPYVSVLEPGDHDGCECEQLEEYEPYDPGGSDRVPELVDSAV